jgi:hypothetical protein
VGGVERRLTALERLVEPCVRKRVVEELEAAIDRLEQHLTPEELRRVLEILADDEELQNGA